MFYESSCMKIASRKISSIIRFSAIESRCNKNSQTGFCGDFDPLVFMCNRNTLSQNSSLWYELAS
jgi:hypothetical protein